MNSVRTPADRFGDLDDFPYAVARAELADGLSMAYVETGPADGPAVVLVHGEPTWGYLYRRMIPTLVDAGLHVIVPDLIGFGRSDKPVDQGDYTYAGHVEWLREALFDILDLRNIVYVGQDWGGLLGMRLLAEQNDRFGGVVMGNTGLPTGDKPMPEVWQKFRQMVKNAEQLDVGRMVDSGCLRDLTDAERAAYIAPFPDEEHSAGARAFPGLVPNTPEDPAAPANKAAWAALSRSTTPFLCAFSDKDPITGGGDRWMREKIPGAAGQPHTTIADAGHFLQEDQPERFAEVIATFTRAITGSRRS